MNTDLLLGGGLALLLGLAGLVLLLRRRPRGRADARPPEGARAAPAASRHPQPGAAAPGHAADAPGAATASLDAQRQATTEALRLARQRKADDSARLAAEREATARAEAQAQAAARPRALPPPLRAPLQAAPPRLPAAAQVSTARPGPAPTLAPAPSFAPAPLPAATPAAAGLPALPAGLRSGPPMVLLVDDSKVVRVKTSRLLEKQGWQVLLADDGLAALQLLDSGAPDLLITDVEMPGLDGFELTRRLRAHPRLGALPVIMITSSDDKHRAQAQAAGVNLLLGKPYSEGEFLAQVQRLLPAGQRLALH